MGATPQQGQQLFDAFMTLVRQAQGQPNTAPAQPIQPPVPKPAPSQATQQMKQQLLTAISSMQKQIAQVKAQRAALQPSKSALIAPNVPAVVAQEIKVEQKALQGFKIHSVYGVRTQQSETCRGRVMDEQTVLFLFCKSFNS